MTREEQNIQLVLDFFKAWEGGRHSDLRDAYDRYLADDIATLKQMVFSGAIIEALGDATALPDIDR